MISKTTAYTTSDGAVCASLAEAQARELQIVLLQNMGQLGQIDAGQLEHVCKLIVTHRAAVLNVLTTTPESRPARRKANGYVGHKRKRGESLTVAEANASLAKPSP